MMLAIGATVNPINSGVDVVYEMPVGKKIAEIVQRDKSPWIVESETVWYNDFPIMFGAPTINSVNVYPALDRWRNLNPDAEKIYNRYAHIKITLSDSPTEFILNGPDNFTVKLNAADLPKLGAGYIFSRNGALENFSTPNLKIQKIYEIILNGADNFTVKLNAADLPKLGAGYICSRNGALENFSTPNLKIQKIYEDAGSFIYKIS